MRGAVKLIAKLEEVTVAIGEEEEYILLDLKTKPCFDKPKGRGGGPAPLGREGAATVGITSISSPSLDQIPFTSLKLSYVLEELEDLVTCHAIEFYDCAFDLVNPKSDWKLKRFKNRTFLKVTATDDPVIWRLANDNAPHVSSYTI